MENYRHTHKSETKSRKRVSVWSLEKRLKARTRECVCVCVCKVLCCAVLTQALDVSEVSSVRFRSYNHSLTLRRSVFCSQLNGILAPFLNLNEDDS